MGAGSSTTSDYLWLDVLLPDDPRLAFLTNRASSDIAATDQLEVRIRTGDLGIHVEIGSAEAVVQTDRDLGARVYGAVHDRVAELARAHHWIRLHMALVELRGRRIGIAGPSGAGKSTCVIAAAQLGATIHGDEAVFIRGGRTVALPRPLHIRPGTLRLFPGLRADVRRLDYAPPVYVLDPAAVGWAPERISVGPLDVLVLLDAADLGTAPQDTPLAEAMTVLMQDAPAFNPDHGRLVREVASLLSSTRLVSVGRSSPERMAAALMRLSEP